MARVLPVPAPASTHSGPVQRGRDLALLGVERGEQVVGWRAGRHGPILAAGPDARAAAVWIAPHRPAGEAAVAEALR